MHTTIQRPQGGEGERAVGRHALPLTGGLQRRGFLATLFALMTAKVFGGQPAAGGAAQGFSVRNGEDRFGKKRTILQVSEMTTKVSTADTGGAMFILEHRHTARGGPRKHFHHEQDEWWYVLEGSYIAEVGAERYQVGPGDSLFGPRKIPHAYAFAGTGVGRILIVMQPAGKIEAMFDSMDGRPRLGSFEEFGLEFVGPALKVD